MIYFEAQSPSNSSAKEQDELFLWSHVFHGKHESSKPAVHIYFMDESLTFEIKSV